MSPPMNCPQQVELPCEKKVAPTPLGFFSRPQSPHQPVENEPPAERKPEHAECSFFSQDTTPFIIFDGFRGLHLSLIIQAMTGYWDSFKTVFGHWISWSAFSAELGISAITKLCHATHNDDLNKLINVTSLSGFALAAALKSYQEYSKEGVISVPALLEIVFGVHLAYCIANFKGWGSKSMLEKYQSIIELFNSAVNILAITAGLDGLSIEGVKENEMLKHGVIETASISQFITTISSSYVRYTKIAKQPPASVVQVPIDRENAEHNASSSSLAPSL